MRIQKRLGLLFLIGILITTTTIASLRRFGQQNPPRSNRQLIDRASWPVTDYVVPQAADPETAAKRKARAKKHDKSDFRVHPDDPSENTTLVDAVDRTLPAFPVGQSTAVLIGSVIDSHAFLSDDRTGIYSEFTIRVDDVLKSDSSDLVSGCLADVERQGGRVRFPSGRTHWYSVDKENMPSSGRQYVFFLTRKNLEEGFQVLTAYEFRGGRVFPLDELPQFISQHGRSGTAFMKDFRSALRLLSAKLFSQRRFHRPV